MRLGKQKFTSGLILSCCLSVLALAHWLTPDSRGYGTHEQLHLPPCAFRALTGLPCVTCGMTTSFAYAARGEWKQSFTAQPVGLLFFVLSIGMAVDSLVALATDRSIRNAGLPWRWIALALGLLVAFAWGYKLLAALT